MFVSSASLSNFTTALVVITINIINLQVFFKVNKKNWQRFWKREIQTAASECNF